MKKLHRRQDNRGWIQLTPKEVKEFQKHDEKVALKLCKTILYQIRMENGNTYIKQL